VADPAFLPAFAPGMTSFPIRTPLGQTGMHVEAVNGNVTLLDYFAAKMFGELASSLIDDDLTDAHLDRISQSIWRAAHSAIRTRPEPAVATTETGKPLRLLPGGAA